MEQSGSRGAYIYVYLKVFFLLVVMIFSAAVGCSPSSAPSAGEKKGEREDSFSLQVVTTIFPLADIAQRIGGEKVKVSTLLPAGASPHTYEPTMEQAASVAEADLIVAVGGGLDDWILTMADAADGAAVLKIMESMDEEAFLEYEVEHLEGDHDHVQDNNGEHEHNCDHGHGTYDPHVWMDPVLVKEKIAPLLMGRLADLLPEEKDYFQHNLQGFQEELQDLSDEIKSTVEAFSQKEFISYHSAWGYFARRYGLEEVAVVEEFPGKEPSARWRANLVDLAEKHSIDVIFAEPQLGSRAADVIAEEIGGQVLAIDPLGGEEVEGRDSYTALIRYNLQQFMEALK